MNTILIVEDELPLRKILKDELIAAGFNVLEAKDGVEGLDVALKNHPDLILVDILMPKMDGITMLKQLREDPLGKKIQVMILSNLSDPASISAALDNQAFEKTCFILVHILSVVFQRRWSGVGRVLSF
jgi:two-component system chemotaxis response regulator CheY